MTLTQAEIFAVLAILLSVLRYGTYLWSIHKGETRPHIFTWFNLGVITSIGAFAQFSLEGGPSSWVLAVVAFTCFFIAFIALFVGEKNITRSDWVAFLGALLAIPLWLATDNPVLAIIMVMIIDGLSCYPTYRKSWHDPWGEPPLSYFWAGLRYFLAIFAVANLSFETLLYPVFLMMNDWGFMLYILWRRRVLSANKIKKSQ